MTVVTACVVVRICPSAGQRLLKTLREKGPGHYPMLTAALARVVQLEALV